MMTIVDFLLARIAEDEAAAREASPSPWSYPGIESVAGGTLYDATRRIADIFYEHVNDHDGSIVRHLLVPEADANGRHIARHDPTRVLAECEAKRRIVESADEATGLDMQVDSEFRVGPRDKSTEPYLGDTILRALALPYAAHPEYRPEWRP